MTRSASDAAYERAVAWIGAPCTESEEAGVLARSTIDKRLETQWQRGAVNGFVAGYLAATSAAQRAGKRGKKGKK